MLCLSLSLLTNEWLFLFCSPNASLPLVPFTACFHSFPMLCSYAFCDVLPHTLLFLLQVEVPPPTTSETLVKEMMTAPFAVPLGVEKEPPSGDVTKEDRQAAKDAQPTLPPAPLTI